MMTCEATAPKRVSVTLDPGLVLERLILRRFSALPRKRAQDWLRSLLAHGFLVEGRWLRDGAAAEPAVPATAFAGWLERTHGSKRARPDAEPALVEALSAEPAVHAGDKPFAHLRKVVG